MAAQAVLVRQTQFAVTGTHGQDQRSRVVFGAVAVDDGLDGAVGPDLADVICDQFSTEAFGLGAHLRHEVRAHDPLGEAGKVLDLGGVHQGPARGDSALEHEGLKLRAGGIDRSGVSRRAGADDDQIPDIGHKWSFQGISTRVVAFRSP